MKSMRTLSIAAVAAIGLALAGCGGGGGTADAPAVTDPPTPTEQIAELQTQINELRAELGLDPIDIDDLTGSVAELTSQVATLTAQLKEKTDAEDAAAAKAMAAKLQKLAMGIGAAGATVTAHTPTAKPDGATDGDAPYAITGWSGSSYSMKSGTTTTTTVVYNNKGPSTPVAFDKKYTTIDANGVLALTAPTATDMDHAKAVDIPGLPTNPNHDGVIVGATNGKSGTFDGVPGVFTAPGSGDGGLEVKVDTKGVASWTGNLSFKPTSRTASVMTPDPAYMNLGWWLAEAANGDLTPTVAAWASGSDMTYTVANLAALLGKATFNGIAVGKYTHKTINSISGGHFNADAELVADFGNATDEGTLTGTIDNFMQDGEAFGEGWMVQLGAARTGAGTADSPFVFDPKAGAAISSAAVADVQYGALGTFGSQKTYGTWNATFVDDSRNDDMPGGVIGHFHIGEASHPVNMVGAFAASNQEADQPK